LARLGFSRIEARFCLILLFDIRGAMPLSLDRQECPKDDQEVARAFPYESHASLPVE
jgi:hypothetical protein